MILLRPTWMRKASSNPLPPPDGIPHRDDNPYQSPQSASQPRKAKPSRLARWIGRAFLSTWSLLAISLFMPANMFVAAGSRQGAESHLELIFIGIGMITLWLVANAFAALWRR